VSNESNGFPEKIGSVEQLEELLSRPTDYCIEALSRTKGDIIILGVAGKMGPTLARMAKRALVAANASSRKVIGVARFSNAQHQNELEQHGIQTIKADLLDQKQLDKLPDAENVVYMPAMKFGSTGAEALTWAMNSYLPGMCAQRYESSKIVAFSTGNIYGLTPVVRGGPTESAELNPSGDYAMSCLGRERIFEHFSRVNKTPVAIIRLNYATEMRYGVFVDVAQSVWSDQEINLAMGAMNAIWQGDANAMTLASFDHVSTPPFILNLSGPELFSLRRVASDFGRMMNKTARFSGDEASDALISNCQKCHRLFGYPQVAPQRMMEWIAQWVMSGGASLGKPTHFETRDGKF
jgi:nucleoside-diphosphate-sugar epimerase